MRASVPSTTVSSSSRLELRRGEGADDAVALATRVADRGDAGGAGLDALLEDDAAGGGDGEGVLEVVEGVVEDDVGPAAHRRELGVDRGREGGESRRERLGVGGVGGGVRRVEPAEGGGDGAARPRRRWPGRARGGRRWRVGGRVGVVAVARRRARAASKPSPARAGSRRTPGRVLRASRRTASGRASVSIGSASQGVSAGPTQTTRSASWSARASEGRSA